jgi:hypothetical protein
VLELRRNELCTPGFGWRRYGKVCPLAKTVSQPADAAYGEFYSPTRTLFCASAYDAINSATTVAEAELTLKELRKQNDLELSSAQVQNNFCDSKIHELQN